MHGIPSVQPYFYVFNVKDVDVSKFKLSWSLLICIVIFIIFISYIKLIVIFRIHMARGTGLTPSTGILHTDLSSYTLEAKAVSATILLLMVRNL